MYNSLEHPVITNMERTGYPDGKEPEWPKCPICGSLCDTFFKDRDGDIFGCDECTTTCDAWEI